MIDTIKKIIFVSLCLIFSLHSSKNKQQQRLVRSALIQRIIAANNTHDITELCKFFTTKHGRKLLKDDKPQYNLSVKDVLEYSPSFYQAWETMLHLYRIISLKGLHTIPIIRNITSLNFTGSNLPHISKDQFAELRALERITLSYCHIATLEQNAFRNLPALKKIYLDNNKFTTLEDNVFVNLPCLEWINLSFGYLKALRANSFKETPNLDSLVAVNNNITFVDPNLLMATPNIEDLDLRLNPLEKLSLKVKPCETGQCISRGYVQILNSTIGNQVSPILRTPLPSTNHISKRCHILETDSISTYVYHPTRGLNKAWLENIFASCM